VVQQLLQSEAVVAVARQLALQSQLLGRDGDLWRLRVSPTRSIRLAHVIVCVLRWKRPVMRDNCRLSKGR
jgi:hypothetical protein